MILITTLCCRAQLWLPEKTEQMRISASTSKQKSSHYSSGLFNKDHNTWVSECTCCWHQHYSFYRNSIYISGNMNSTTIHLTLKMLSTPNTQELYQISFGLLLSSIIPAAFKTTGQFYLTLKVFSTIM